MNPISIRKVTANELPILREMSIRTFLDSFAAVNSESDMQDYISKSRSPEQILEEFSNPESAFYFALSDEKPIGYMKLNSGKAQIENRDQNSFEIQQIYVDKGFQNQRIGQLLFDKAISIASEAKCDFIWLGVWEKNPGAIRFYEKNGFEVYGKHSFRLGSDLQSDLLMKRKI